MRPEDYLAIEQLHHRYIAAIDDGKPDAFVDLFRPDADVTVGTREMSGHDELRTFVEDSVESRGPVFKHFVSNPRIDIDGDEATAQWDYAVFKADDPDNGDGEWALGRYDTRYARIDGDWKIAELTARRTYTADL